MMAKKVDTHLFNVAVVGLSGTEREKGDLGVGKSCLCNRFVSPLADDYYTDHISVLSQSDFGGRVVNNDHFLYWGEVTKTTDEGVDFNFRVVEQTEFVDDSSFLPFKSGKTDPYHKRCATAKLSSAEKLMYICKNQLGLEHDFEQKFLPEGKITIDGFLCVFDVSQVANRPPEKQVEFATLVLNSLMKTKKPVVVATTKNDEAFMNYTKDVDRLVAKKDYRGMISVVETSAHENINVELAFITLAHLIEKNKGRIKIVPYVEASRARKEVLDVATDAYKSLIKMHVPDYLVTWITTRKKFEANPDYQHYVDLFGVDRAKKEFLRYTKKLKNEHLMQKEKTFSSRLPGLLNTMLPDLATIDDRSWNMCKEFLRIHDDFDLHFIDLGEEVVWQECNEYVDGEDNRLPFDWLSSNDAEICFRNHVNNLQAEQKRLEWKRQFKVMLEDNIYITPGQSLTEVSVFFLGRECFESLSDADKSQVFLLHQQELKEKARHDFQELLLERADIFARFDPPVNITMEDLEKILEELQEEDRYKKLDKLEEDRKVMILNHLGFIQCPARDRCPSRDHCAEARIEHVLAKHARRPQSWCRSQWTLDAEDSRLNLVLLGSEGLADELATVIRSQCQEDEYVSEDVVYSLDYRPIDGDVSLPQNSLRTPDFMPQGCFCVYSSHDSLEYLRDSLEKTLMSDLENEERLPFQGLPLVIILAHDTAMTEKGVMMLREDGQSLAVRLQCPFVDLPEFCGERKVHPDQVMQGLDELVKCIRHRAALVNLCPVSESIEPDIRIVMCLMCGDPYMCELVLGPLLSHQCCFITSDRYPTITVEMYLDQHKRKVEVTVTSYHAGAMIRDDLNHGFVLVYSARRKASFSSLKAFCENIPNEVPLSVLAVTESGGANAFFGSDYSQALITDGNKLADEIGARFMTTSTNFQQQTAVFNPFFKEAFDRKLDTEYSYSADELSRTEQSEKSLSEMERRPPATLPKPTRGHEKRGSSNSQSTEDSEERLYDEPVTHRHLSDSEHDRSLSASPTPMYDQSVYSRVNTQDNGIYSEVPPDDHVVLPSQIRQRRSIFAERHRRSCPDTSLLSQLAMSPSQGVKLSLAPSAQSKDSLDETVHPRHTVDRPPNYQFRKTKSMKLALREDDDTHHDEDTSHDDHLPEEWMINSLYERQNASPKRQKPPVLPKPLNLDRFRKVQNAIDQQHTSPKRKGSSGAVQAPLAEMEPVEIGDYATVADAVNSENSDYALVQDALPPGKFHRIRSTVHRKDRGGTDSDSEFSSIERKENSVYSRVNRKPTPHKKKHKSKPVTTGSADQVYEEPPPLPPYPDASLLHPVQSNDKQRLIGHSASEGSEGTGDECSLSGKKTKKRRSFRSKKKENHRPVFDSETSQLLPSEISYEDEHPYEDIEYATKDEMEDGNKMSSWTKAKEKEFEKQQRKLAKKLRDDEKKRQKEEERRLKEKQKIQRKSLRKKKEAKLMPRQTTNTLQNFVQNEGQLVPVFVEKCIKFVEAEGLEAEGIYRVPGNKAHVEQLQARFTEDKMVDFHSLDIPVNAVATALKGFFSDLSEPLIPNYLYEELIQAAGILDRTERLKALRSVLKKLPPVNHEVLKYLVTHLQHVTEYCAKNQMDSKNLAICWWPTLLHPEFKTFELMAQVSKYLEEIVHTLVSQVGFLFYNMSEVTEV